MRTTSGRHSSNSTEAADRSSRPDTGREPYKPPAVVALGTLAELTESGGGPRVDATAAGGPSAISDRRLKREIRAVDADAVLDAVRSLPVSSWSYLWEDDGVRHVGPMAQDFAAAFAVGSDDRHISLVDANGVALAAIQALAEHVQGLEHELEALRAALASRAGSPA